MNYKYSKRNFGFGRKMSFAVKEALKDKFGEGRYQTRKAHHSRFNQFIKFIKSEGIRDLTHVQYSDIESYAFALAQAVKNSSLTLSYATNLLSSINVVFECLREDSQFSIKPSQYVGRRTHKRKKPLHYISIQETEDTYQALKKIDFACAVVFGLTRTCGLRLREALMFEPRVALKQFNKFNQINITRGTKGGRKVARWVSVSPFALSVLRDALEFCKSNESRNLLDPNQMLIKSYRRIGYKLRRYLKESDHGSIRDLRCMYACDRMAQLLGHAVPILGGEIKDKEQYYGLAQVVSNELGHNRAYVINSYCG